MPNHDPMLGVAFVAAIFIVALFATLFPEKPQDSKPSDRAAESDDEIIIQP